MLTLETIRKIRFACHSLGFPLPAFLVVTLSNTQPILNKLVSVVPH